MDVTANLDSGYVLNFLEISPTKTLVKENTFCTGRMTEKTDTAGSANITNNKDVQGNYRNTANANW